MRVVISIPPYICVALSITRDTGMECILKHYTAPSNKRLLQLLSSMSGLLTCLIIVLLYTRTEPELYMQRERECSRINAVMFVSGYNASRDSVITIKSVLIYRHDTIHFHFIVDDKARKVLEVVMTTWQVPGVSFTFYDMEYAKSLLPWSFNHYYKTDWTILVPLLHKILPHSVFRVVILNPDIVLTTDIGKLWCHCFSDKEQVVGIGWRNWNATYDRRPYPSGTYQVAWNSRRQAVAPRTSPGVMVVDVLHSRSLSWNRKWIHAIHRHIRMDPPELRFKECAIIEILKSHPEASFSLSCEWNIHTAEYWTEECSNSSLSVMDRTTGARDGHLSSHVNYVQSFDGYKLREAKLTNCFASHPQSTQLSNWTMESDMCAVTNWQNTAHREHPFFLGHEYTPTDRYDITMVGHLTIEKLSLLEHISQKWEGPISIVVSMVDTDINRFVNFVESSAVLQRKTNISYHVLFKDRASFPLSSLQVLAHKHVQTPYVFFNDLNGIPSNGLYHHLREVIQLQGDREKVALLVPMFQTNTTTPHYPHTKQEILHLISEGKIFQTCNQYLNSTAYSHWRVASEPYNIRHKWVYEPCIVAKTSVMSSDPTFTEDQQNSTSHSSELFVVVPEGFLVHTSHPHDRLTTDLECYKSRLSKCLHNTS